jgi:hypothetical protein
MASSDKAASTVSSANFAAFNDLEAPVFIYLPFVCGGLPRADDPTHRRIILFKIAFGPSVAENLERQLPVFALEAATGLRVFTLFNSMMRTSMMVQPLLPSSRKEPRWGRAQA